MRMVPGLTPGTFPDTVMPTTTPGGDMNSDYGYACCGDHGEDMSETYEMRDALPRDLTEKIKAARLLRDAGHITIDAYAACIVSIVDGHIPG